MVYCEKIISASGTEEQRAGAIRELSLFLEIKKLEFERHNK
jgi:hypothetical protein